MKKTIPLLCVIALEGVFNTSMFTRLDGGK